MATDTIGENIVRLYYGPKTYELQVDFSYSARVVRAQIENLTGVPKVNNG